MRKQTKDYRDLMTSLFYKAEDTAIYAMGEAGTGAYQTVDRIFNTVLRQTRGLVQVNTWQQLYFETKREELE